MADPIPIRDAADQRVRDYEGLSDPELRRRREGSSGAEWAYFVAEGAIVIRQLLRSPYRVRSLLVSPSGLRSLGTELDEVEAPVYLAQQPVLEAICGFPFHRGALATADRRPLPRLGDVAAGASLLVVVEGVNDHENLGGIFRNAAAFGAGGVVLDPTCADPLYRRSLRVSVGHVLNVPYTQVDRWPDALDDLRGQGFELLALTPAEGAEDLATVGAEPPFSRSEGPIGPRRVLLLGSEGSGLSASALAAADRRVRIPMAPGVDSPNIATAAAIALHWFSTCGRPGGVF